MAARPTGPTGPRARTTPGPVNRPNYAGQQPSPNYRPSGPAGPRPAGPGAPRPTGPGGPRPGGYQQRPGGPGSGPGGPRPGGFGQRPSGPGAAMRGPGGPGLRPSGGRPMGAPPPPPPSGPLGIRRKKLETD